MTEMHSHNRRSFTTAMMGSLLTLSLVHSASRAQAIEGSVKPVARKWLLRMEEACAAVSSARMSPTDWQREIDELLSRVDMADLLKAISFEALAKLPYLPPDHESITRIRFYDDHPGLPGPLHFSAYLFALKKDVSVVPHGHHNMVTMHMMLKGRAHARQCGCEQALGRPRLRGSDAGRQAGRWPAAGRAPGPEAGLCPLRQGLNARALALDPKHRGVHEYIGEAYLMAGNLPKGV